MLQTFSLSNTRNQDKKLGLIENSLPLKLPDASNLLSIKHPKPPPEFTRYSQDKYDQFLLNPIYRLNFHIPPNMFRQLANHIYLVLPSLLFSQQGILGSFSTSARFGHSGNIYLFLQLSFPCFVWESSSFPSF